MKVSVLGPVGIHAAGRPLLPRSGKIRCLAAVLALDGRRPVSAARLTDVLWNGSPPPSAHKNVHQYVHRLRRMLSGHGLSGRLVWQPAGYLLRLWPDELDLDRFEALAAAGRRLRDRGDLVAASRSLTEALALWHGDPLADVRGSQVLNEIAHALAERRMMVVEERIAIDLRLGRFGLLVPQLGALVAEHPLRERLREYQMLALYGVGRRAEALAVYHDCRSVLARDLGIDPGPALGELLSRMLADDGELTATAPAAPQPGMASVRPLGRRIGRALSRPPGRAWQ